MFDGYFFGGGSLSLVVWGYLVWNMGTLLLMGWDKGQSRRSGAERVPEGLLFFLAAAFGSAGIFLGMLVFRHKTRIWYFLLGMPLLIVENLALLQVVLQTVGGLYFPR